ncbi:hypothetical protein [Mycoplasma parvum]|uniref:Uncharacterized protein n=1 Tax=Mycoplasma parvum str. Indiana TaxID=1403316 RepID=U5NCG4_9MOLU|nr:hypothetical protein [Mycoplasma parvum]AGX89276.1 hypothetical protein PRV_02750 [Mycoplasma parvum str. Indiana]
MSKVLLKRFLPISLVGISVSTIYLVLVSSNSFGGNSPKKWPVGSIGVKVWFDQSYIKEWLVNGNGIASDYFDRRDSTFFNKPENNKSFKLEEKNVKDSDLSNNSLKISFNEYESKNRDFWSSNFVLTGTSCEQIQKDLSEYYKYRTKKGEGEQDNGLEKLWLKDGKIFYKTGYRSPFGIIPVTLVAGGFKCANL